MIYLAFDIGTTGTKAALITAEGEVLETGYQSYVSFSAEGGIAEQDANDWYLASCQASKQLDGTKAEAIVLTGQMQNVILLDALGEPLRPVILYSDSRARKEAQAFQNSLGIAQLRKLTGNDQEAGSLLAKLEWLKTHERSALAKARYLLLGAADYLAFKLTGQAFSDSTTASTTGLMDLATRDWADGLLKELKLLEFKPLFPQLVTGGQAVGQVQPDKHEALGVRAGLPVYLAPGDAASASLGIGSGVVGQAYAYMGSSGWLAFSSTSAGLPEKGVFSLAHPDPKLFICIAPLLTAGGNLDWAKTQFGYNSYDTMIGEALARPISPLLYLPYLQGERSPFSDPHARAAFIGLNASHSKADMARAVLEGLAFAYKQALEALIDEPVAKLLLTGGGSRSPAFAQLLASISGLTLGIPNDTEYTGLRGAVLAAEALKNRRGYQLKPEIRYEFMPELVPAYQEKYQLFLEAYKQLKDLFKKMAAFSN